MQYHVAPLKSSRFPSLIAHCMSPQIHGHPLVGEAGLRMRLRLRLRSHTESALTYNLCAPDDGLYVLSWPSTGTGYATRDFDETGEDASTNAFFLTSVRFHTSLDELDLPRMKEAADLGYKG